MYLQHQIHIDKYLLRLERAILLGRLTVLEQELDREVCFGVSGGDDVLAVVVRECERASYKKIAGIE